MAGLPGAAAGGLPAAAGPSASALAAVEIDRAVHPSGIVPTLQNIVATVNLDCELDLKSIALHARNAEYNPKARAWGQRAAGPLTVSCAARCGLCAITLEPAGLVTVSSPCVKPQWASRSTAGMPGPLRL
jgi:hypothetical protein